LSDPVVPSSDSELRTHVERVLSPHYELDCEIGRGGMGVVYRARQPDLDRTVALKLIAPEALEDAAARERFVSEARHAAAIEHPNVVPIYAAGESDGVAYFVMRLVEGDDLRTRVRRDGPLAPAKAAEIAHSVGAALDAIHSAGLVHRDVKPANILLAAGDHVYLTDFGLARAALARAGTTTGRGRWAGSLHYAAPEQIRGGRVDARADVYASGGVLFFMLTGRVPFDRDSDEATLWAHVSEPPPRPSALRRGLPRAFDEVIARAMAKHPDDRYASAGDLGRAALAAAQGRRAPRRRGIVAQGAASPSGALAVPGLRDDAPTLTAATAAAPAAARRRRNLLAVAGAAMAAAVVALALVAVFDRRRPAPSAAARAARSTPTASATPTATATPVATPHVARVFRHIGPRPNGIALAGRRLWVTSASARLLRLDALTGRGRSRDSRVPSSRAVAVAGRTVWVANPHSRELLAFDARTQRLLARIPEPNEPTELAPDRAGGVWVAVRDQSARTADLARQYDARGRLLREMPFPYGIAALVARPHALWIAERRRSRVDRVDLRNGRARDVEVIRPARALAWGAGHVWATSPDDDALARIDPKTKAVRTRTVGPFPMQIAVTHGRVFVACENDDAVAVVDPRTMRPLQRLPMPFNPYAVTADARHVWVTSLGENAVVKIDVD
jgi:Protein kinase domain